MLKRITKDLIKETIHRARLSPRRRAHLSFHKYSENLQRMVNVYLKDAYIPPHKHERPDKTEVFIALKGRLLAVTFDDEGNVTDHTVFGINQETIGVEIPPKTYHAFWTLSDIGVVYEIIDGPYNPKTHKKFAPFAPNEFDKDAAKYMRRIKTGLGIK